MTTKTMIDNIRKSLKAKSDSYIADTCGIDKGCISRMQHDPKRNLDMTTLKRFHIGTGIPIGQLAEWWLEGQENTNA